MKIGIFVPMLRRFKKSQEQQEGSEVAAKEIQSSFQKFFNPFNLAPKEGHQKKSSLNDMKKTSNKSEFGEEDPLLGDQDQINDVHGRNAPNPQKHLPTLYRQAYNGRDLSLMLRQNAETGVEDKITNEEYDWLKNPEGNVNQEDGLADFLDYSLSILDKVFFFGLVQEVVPRVALFATNERPAGTGLHPNAGAVWLPETSIIYFNKSVRADEKEIISNLLHEMCHVFLETFSCPFRKCSQTVGAVHNIHGATGHGPIFCNAISRIQDAMTRELGWQANCGIDRAVQTEMRASQWEPTEKQLVRWHLEHLMSPHPREDNSSHLNGPTALGTERETLETKVYRV